MRSWLLALVSLILIAGCQPFWQSDKAPDKATVSQDSVAQLPSGWRWESYGGIEVGVPGNWGWGTSEWPWCLDQTAGPPAPYVGRPGVVPAIACLTTNDGTPDSAFSIKKGGTFVWFSKSLDKAERPVVVEGDRATLTRAWIDLKVQAPEAMRKAILHTLRTIPHGANGCPLTHPISDNPAWRPGSPGRVESLTGVTSVTACKYGEGFLVSNVHMEAAAARKAVAGVVSAPDGGGPDSPHTCVKSSAYGEGVIVLEIVSKQRNTEVVMRYDGCDHHGFDDGHSVRALTHDAVHPFLVGPNRLTSYSSDLADILAEPIDPESASSQGSG